LITLQKKGVKKDAAENLRPSTKKQWGGNKSNTGISKLRKGKTQAAPKELQRTPAEINLTKKRKGKDKS